MASLSQNKIDRTAFVLVVLTMLAPALGGSTALWAQAVISLSTGVFFILSPPKRSLGPLLNAVFIAIGVVALIGFLPVHWFAFPEWRTVLLKFGVHLPDTWSPQPWLTLESGCLWSLGLAWTYYLFAYQWNPAFREKAWDAFCFGILCLAATLTIAFALNKHVPFWPDVREFGFFPNRNQTSNVLGLAGIMIYANAFQHLQRGRKAGWIWLASLGLICWALILNYSRAGIILFFSGTVTWHVWWLLRSKEDTRKAIAWGPLAMLLALLFVAGGDTLLRFGKEFADLFSPGRNARVLIYHDAFDLFKQSPLLGIGLGNFRSLFSAHRRFYITSSESIHPESDWLWVAVEMGCLVPLLLLGSIGIWSRRCFPFQPGTWRDMRAAAMISGIAFTVHGFFDVSGHRIGALWPALFLASTAINPKTEYGRSQMIATVFRMLGVLFIAIGIWWFVSIMGAKSLPTTATVNRLTAQSEAATSAEDYDKAIALASEALKIAPLNWVLYYNRGFAEGALYRARSEVLRDFAVARYLLPNWPNLYLKEGQLWLSVGEPNLAFDVWEEGMRRWPENAPVLYEQIFGVVQADPDLRDRWRRLGYVDRQCLPVLLRSADRLGFEIERERLFSEDPQLRSFTPDELQVLFAAWYEKGDKLSLAQSLQEHPDWQKIAWKELARAYADYQDYRPAYETLRQFAPPPNVPRLNPDQSLVVLQSRFRLNPTDLKEGFALYSAQIKEGKIDDALATLESLVLLDGSPKYLWYLEAELWAQKKDWQKAWQALQRYAFGSG